MDQKRNRSCSLAGQLALRIVLQFDGDQVLHAESVRNRPRDEFIGGGDDHQLGARVRVLPHQVERLLFDAFLHHSPHKTCVSSYRIRSALFPDRRRGKTHVVMQVKRSGLVLLKKTGVQTPELDAIAPAQRDGEFAPLVVGIERHQRVVQVE